MTRISWDSVLPSVLLLWLCAIAHVHATSLEEIQRYADTGAIKLALKIMDREQPALEKQPEQWMAWERQRISLYEARQDWAALAGRLAKLPEFVSADFILFARGKRAEAFIANNQGAQAREVLRSLIWSGVEYDQEQLANWRRLIIQSYLGDGLAADARISAVRFQQDFAKQAEADLPLRARIALLNEQYSEVINILGAHDANPAGNALRLLAQLRGKSQTASKVLQATQQALRNTQLDKETFVNLWVVAAEAAQAAEQLGSRANALEHVIAEHQHISLPRAIINPTSDDLWQAYMDYATQISNKEQLLIGQDDKWLALAGSMRQQQPVGARALTAFVMLHGRNAKLRAQAANTFVEMISARRQGTDLLRAMFSDSVRFSERSTIPEPVRHKLVDLALASGDIDLASEIMATIEEPPAGADQFMWQLRRARILVLGNKPALGAQALHDILHSNPKLEQLQVDRLMQVLFDLQTTGEHESAYTLFATMMTRTADEKLQREIYYWMAESRKAQERYDEAAQLYLQSAMHPDPKNMDPWAQTAHYQAAEALSRAGMLDDAQALFERLLRVTEDPTRRATLKSALQKLWAKQ